jgi:hypothetical protein
VGWGGTSQGWARQGIAVTTQPKDNMYLELWMAVQDAFAEIPCDFCEKTNEPLANLVTINTEQARILNSPIGIFHSGCATVLLAAFREPR